MTGMLAVVYRSFGERWARGTSPLYEEWAVGIADDPEMLARIAALPPAKQQPNLVFAAARWAGCPLSPYPQWRDWLLDRWDEVVEVAAGRTTQTNEPNRCATLLPALSAIDGPIALLETGAAAGRPARRPRHRRPLRAGRRPRRGGPRRPARRDLRAAHPVTPAAGPRRTPHPT